VVSAKKKASSRWQRLKANFDFGVLVVGAVLALALAASERRFESAFTHDNLRAAPYPQLSVVLFLAACAVIALWYFTISGELEMLRTYGEEFAPPLPELRLQVVFLGTALALLVYFYKTPSYIRRAAQCP